MNLSFNKSILLASVFISSVGVAAQKDMVAHGITNAKIIVKSANGLAAVQPTATLQFEYASCKMPSFSVKVSKPKSGPTQLTVMTKDGLLDCFGPALNRVYTLQVSSDAKMGTSFVLNNPLAVEYTSAQKVPTTPIVPPIATMPVEDLCLVELEKEMIRQDGPDGFESLSPISKEEAIEFLLNAPSDELSEAEIRNAQDLVRQSDSLTYALQWTAPSNSGTSVVITSRNNCKKYQTFVTWSEE